jgi:DNA mismatch repair protein MutS
MMFYSILFPEPDPGAQVTSEVPACFPDLNLDQIVDAITASKQEYDLKSFFYSPLKDAGAISYRHEILHDLDGRDVFESILGLEARMRTMRAHLALGEKLHYRYQKKRWFLDAVDVYVDAVSALSSDLSRMQLRSRGFVTFRESLGRYVASERFSRLHAWTKRLKRDLDDVSYCFLIKGNTVRVRKPDSEKDYSEEVLEAFKKFKQGPEKDYRIKRLDEPGMNHVEESVLEMVARLYPETFLDLDEFCSVNAGFQDELIARFDREIQFYVSYLEFIASFKAAGLPFCYPSISASNKDVFATDAFDLALASRLARNGDGNPIVGNDFRLGGRERIIVVSGPNQGGKTTFARMFGQLHWLSSLGLPVPARESRTRVFNGRFTHFEREETIENLRGKLQDEIDRIHEILAQATSDSIVIMNEIFTSTTVADAVFLGKKIIERIVQLDLLCVCVTFLDELASFGPQTVSMVSTVVPDNTALRTYKILRRPADGLSYAISIAEKYRLTYNLLKDRVRS